MTACDGRTSAVAVLHFARGLRVLGDREDRVGRLEAGEARDLEPAVGLLLGCRATWWPLLAVARDLRVVEPAETERTQEQHGAERADDSARTTMTSHDYLLGPEPRGPCDVARGDSDEFTGGTGGAGRVIWLTPARVRCSQLRVSVGISPNFPRRARCAPYLARARPMRGQRRPAWSEEGGGELVVVVGPPAAPAVVLLHAPGPVPHRDRVRVTGVDAAPDGGFDAVDGIVHRGEQLRPAVAVQSVGVGDESEPCRPVGGPPAEPGLVEVVVDRYAEAGELGEVVDGAAGAANSKSSSATATPSRKTTFESSTSLWHTSVPPAGSARRVVPGETLRVEPAGGVVQPAQQPGDGRQRGVGLAPVRIGRHGDLAVDEHEALASVLVDADR